MRRVHSTCLGIAMCAVALMVHAAPTTKPSSPTTRPAGARLFGPYEKLTSLTSEQRDKIHEIRRKYLADVHDLEHKQTEDITALLSDDQKKELQEIEEKTTAEAKTKAGAKKETGQ
jgi:Spy/CpxP family protein refolding chaperone